MYGDNDFRVDVIAGGMACSERYGNIVGAMEGAGIIVEETLHWDVEHATASEQSSAALKAAAESIRKISPNALVLLGDRYETAAVALAATLCGIPVVHLHGGEETEGAFDNALRHAITKLSHLHFVAHEEYARRVRQMGEDPDTVHVVGSLGVDNLIKRKLPSRAEIEAFIGKKLGKPLGVVTVHPTTLVGSTANEDAAGAVMEAMRNLEASWVVTLPNADPGNVQIREAFIALGVDNENISVVNALGEERYLGLVKTADFVLGNSSSGMIEAPALRVPTINVGDRQKGRLRFPSIIDAPCEAQAVLDAIELALSPDFTQTLADMKPPYGDGRAAEQIVSILRDWVPPDPPRKHFYDMEVRAKASDR